MRRRGPPRKGPLRLSVLATPNQQIGTGQADLCRPKRCRYRRTGRWLSMRPVAWGLSRKHSVGARDIGNHDAAQEVLLPAQLELREQNVHAVGGPLSTVSGEHRGPKHCLAVDVCHKLCAKQRVDAQAAAAAVCSVTPPQAIMSPIWRGLHPVALDCS